MPRPNKTYTNLGDRATEHEYDLSCFLFMLMIVTGMGMLQEYA